MKHHTTLFAIMSLVACGSGVVKADLLSNGNLDTASVSGQVLPTPTGWTASANRTATGAFNDGMSSEGFANVLDPGGLGLFFKPFQGALTNKITATLYQDNPGIPGLSYTLTGWAGAEANYIGLSDPTVKSEFHLQFLNGASVVIGNSTLDLVAAGLGTGAATPPASGFSYHPFSISAIAPAGTVSVRALATMVDAYGNPAGGGQAFVVDAFSLVPEPSVIALAGLGTLALIFRRRK